MPGGLLWGIIGCVTFPPLMNTLTRSLLLLSATVLPVMAAPSLVTEAQRDYNAGRYAEAKAKFLRIQAENPSNVVAKNYLRMIETVEKEAPKTQLRSQLAALTVETIAVREASLESVLEMLPQWAGKASEGKVKPSFVVQPGVDLQKPITLQLSNVPYTEVLRYVGIQGGVRFQIDQYAVRVAPASQNATAEQAAQEAPAP